MSPKVTEDNSGALDESKRLEFGLVNIDSHDSNVIEWTDVLEIIMIIILVLGILRVVVKWRKRRNAKKMSKMATLMASAQPNTAQQTHVQMTNLPVLRTARVLERWRQSGQYRVRDLVIYHLQLSVMNLGMNEKALRGFGYT